jgi:hypothetical protein
MNVQRGDVLKAGFPHASGERRQTRQVLPCVSRRVYRRAGFATTRFRSAANAYRTHVKPIRDRKTAQRANQRCLTPLISRSCIPRKKSAW